jgi:hypothetical protein
MKHGLRIDRFAAALAAAALLLPAIVCSQIPDVRFRVWVTQTDSGFRPKTSSPAYFGIHPNATYCIDTMLTGFTDHWFENDNQTVNEYPYWPPCSPSVEIRLFNTKAGCFEMTGVGRQNNIHQYHDTTEIDTFKLRWCVFDSLAFHPQIFRWPSVLKYYCDSMTMTDPTGLANVNMRKDSSWTYYPDQDPNGITSVIITMWGPRVPPLPPAQVVLTSPPNGDTGRPLTDTLVWNPVAGAARYHVQVSSSPSFASLVADDTVTATSVIVSGLSQLTTYYWRASASNAFGVSVYQTPPDSFTTQQTLDVKESGNGLPRTFSLSQNYPNPFNPSTHIRFSVSQSARVRLTVYDILGKEISTVLAGDFAAGTYSGVWLGMDGRGSPLSSGIYYMRMVADAGPVDGRAPERFVSTIKMIISR